MHTNIYTDKIGDCLFVYLFICSVWTAKLQGLTGWNWEDVKSPNDEYGLGAVAFKCHLRWVNEHKTHEKL